MKKRSKEQTHVIGPRILADECIPTITVYILRQLGFDIVHIRESYRGTKDPAVLKLALLLHRILLTQDKELFNALCQETDIDGAVLLRAKGSSGTQKATILNKFFSNTYVGI